MADLPTSSRYGQKEWEAFVALSNNTHFLNLIDYWNRRCQLLAITSTVISDDVKNRWAQGRTQEIGEVVREFQEARKNLDKLSGGRQ